MPNRLRPKYLSVWLSSDGHRALQERTKKEGASRSDLVRRMLAYATQHMPKGWHP